MNILFIKTESKSFINQDIAILRKHFHHVREFLYREGSGFDHLKSQIRLFFFLLGNIWTADLIYIWFASYHSFLPTLFAKLWRKKSFVVIGGHDAAREPELGYGAHLKPLRSWAVKRSVDFATRVLTVSKFTDAQLFQYVNEKNREKTTIIYNGVNVDFFRRVKGAKKEERVVTVCGTSKVKILRRKGIDLFIAAAERLPRYSFHIFGLSGAARESLGENLPPNVVIHPFVPLETLINEYSRAKVACQFSRYEAFGLAIAEAMACECIPVGFNYGGTPEIIDEVGFLIDQFNPDVAARAIQKAMEAPEALGKAARQRIVDNFSIDLREKKLVEIIKEMFSIP